MRFFRIEDECIEFIHIKHKADSARLSHLFNQGVVSVTTLLQDDEFRSKAIKKLISKLKGKKRELVEGLLGLESGAVQKSKIRIVYAVLGYSKKGKIPFFSQVSYMRATNTLQLLGFKVGFSWIESVER